MMEVIESSQTSMKIDSLNVTLNAKLDTVLQILNHNQDI
jgi:hypothetical protein